MLCEHFCRHNFLHNVSEWNCSRWRRAKHPTSQMNCSFCCRVRVLLLLLLISEIKNYLIETPHACAAAAVRCWNRLFSVEVEREVLHKGSFYWNRSILSLCFILCYTSAWAFNTYWKYLLRKKVSYNRITLFTSKVAHQSINILFLHIVDMQLSWHLHILTIRRLQQRFMLFN